MFLTHAYLYIISIIHAICDARNMKYDGYVTNYAITIKEDNTNKKQN